MAPGRMDYVNGALLAMHLRVGVEPPASIQPAEARERAERDLPRADRTQTQEDEDE